LLTKEPLSYCYMC